MNSNTVTAGTNTSADNNNNNNNNSNRQPPPLPLHGKPKMKTSSIVFRWLFWGSAILSGALITINGILMYIDDTGGYDQSLKTKYDLIDLNATGNSLHSAARLVSVAIYLVSLVTLVIEKSFFLKVGKKYKADIQAYYNETGSKRRGDHDSDFKRIYIKVRSYIIEVSLRTFGWAIIGLAIQASDRLFDFYCDAQAENSKIYQRFVLAVTTFVSVGLFLLLLCFWTYSKIGQARRFYHNQRNPSS